MSIRFIMLWGPDDTTLEAFVTSTTHDMWKQNPLFGRHINMLDSNVHEDMNAYFNVVLETFVKELSELSSEPFFFIIDEFDLCDNSDEVQHFVHQVIHHLPDHCKLILNGRTYPRLPWVAMTAHKEALIFNDDHIITKNFYNFNRSSPPKLELYTLGPGYVLLDQEMIDNWDGHLPRLLLFFALDRHIVTRSEICHAFWPDLDMDQAVNVFHVTKRRLHKALDLDVLVHDDTFYRMNPEIQIYYDGVEFAEVLMEARDPNNPNPFESWVKAASIYRGLFLQGHSEDWILDRQVSYRTGHIEALSNIAQRWLAEDRPELALKHYLKAVEADDTREDVLRDTMQLYVEIGRSNEAARLYQNFANRLKKLKCVPKETTRQYYEKITT